MTDRRPVCISVAVILVLLVVILPVAAGAGDKAAPSAQETGASPVEAGSETSPPATASQGAAPEPTAGKTGDRGDATVPTPTTKPTTQAKTVTAAPAAPARADDRPGDGGAGSGDGPTPACSATTVPATAPSAALQAGNGARAGEDAGKTAGGGDVTTSRSAVPTATTTLRDPARSGTGGEGPAATTTPSRIQSGAGGDGEGPGGMESAVTPTGGPKAGGAATATPVSAAGTAPAGGGSAPASAGQRSRVAESGANDDQAAAGTGGTAADSRVVVNPAFPPPAAQTASMGGMRTAAGVDPSANADPASAFTGNRPLPGATSLPAGGSTGSSGTGGRGPDTTGFPVVPDDTRNRSGGGDGRNGTESGQGGNARGRVLGEGARPTASPDVGDLYEPRFIVRAGAAGSGGERAVPKDPPGGPRPGDGGGRRGAPTPPVPPAAPARTGLEPPAPAGCNAGRMRKESPSLPLPAETEGGVPDPLLLLRCLLFLGYRRIRPGNVLDHPVRRGLTAAIAADPGLDLAGCVAATGANRETLRYHLALLVCGGKVLEEARNGSVGYFPAGTPLTPVHRAVLHLRRNPSLAPLLHRIRDAPGISRRELADLLGVAGPSVNRQVRRLVEEGLVERRRCGQSQRYWLTHECVEVFAAIAMAEAARERTMQTSERASA